jgi:pimeloyl-ACP methyl ester carboxylesterase
MDSALSQAPTFITVGKGDAARRLAVRSRAGDGPALVWLGGFRSDMGATKAMVLDAYARDHGRALVRFDYTGHGESEGEFAESTISTWLEDAMAVLDATVTGPAILVGSSMGGWIACLAARARALRGDAPPCCNVSAERDDGLDLTRRKIRQPALMPRINDLDADRM